MVGRFFENPLTRAGVEYVREQIKDNPCLVSELWTKFYSEELGSPTGGEDEK